MDHIGLPTVFPATIEISASWLLVLGGVDSCKTKWLRRLWGVGIAVLIPPLCIWVHILLPTAQKTILTCGKFEIFATHMNITMQADTIHHNVM